MYCFFSKEHWRQHGMSTGMASWGRHRVGLLCQQVVL